LDENKHFVEKLKFLGEIKMFAKKSTFWRKIQILSKNQIDGAKSMCCNMLAKKYFFAKDLYFGQKS